MKILNRTQATNNLVQTVSGLAQNGVGAINDCLQTGAIVHLNQYRAMDADGSQAGVFGMPQWEIVDHGIQDSQYFQGCGPYEFEHVSTGIGDNPKDALTDAIESIAMDVRIPSDLLETLESYDTEPSAYAADVENCEGEGLDELETESALENSENSYRVSVRYDLEFSASATAIGYAESIVNGNCKTVIEQLHTMPIVRALAVTGYIVNDLSSNSDTSYVGRFLNELERLDMPK